MTLPTRSNGDKIKAAWFNETKTEIETLDTAQTAALAATTGTTNNDFAIGDGTDTNKSITAQNGDTNKPQLRYNASGDAWEFSNNGVDYSEMGSGSGGGIQYITEGNAESGIGDFTRYANTAAGDRPDDFGGTVSATTVWDWELDTSTPMFGAQNFKLDKKTATDIQGEGVYYPFTLENGHLHTKLINEQVTKSSGTYADGNLKMFIVSSSDSFVADFNVIDITPSDVLAGELLNLVGAFQTDATDLEYRLCIHCTSTDTDIYAVDFDEIKVWKKNASIGQIQNFPMYDRSGFGDITGTDWVTSANAAHFYPYSTVDEDGTEVWRLAFNISGAVITPVTSLTLTIAGIIFRDTGGNGHQSVSTDGASSGTHYIQRSIAVENSNTIVINMNSTETGFYVSGDVTLAGKPDWATQSYGGFAKMSNTTLNRDIFTEVSRATSNQTIPAATPTVIQFNTLDEDRAGAWQSGSYEFKVLESASYEINPTIGLFNASGTAAGTSVILYINGVPAPRSTQYSLNNGEELTHSPTWTYDLTEGDLVSISVTSTQIIDVYSSAVVFGGSRCTFKKSSSNSQTIFESESVYADYTGNAGEAITAGSTNIPFANKVEDSHGFWNGTQFTPSESMRLLITGVAYFSATGNYTIGLYVEGVLIKLISTASSGFRVIHFSGQIKVNANQVVSVREQNSSGKSLTDADNIHTISITRIK